MEKLAENDLTYFYLRHVVIVVAAITTISLMPVDDRLYHVIHDQIVIEFVNKPMICTR